ncbi:MAG: hypothetical protein ACE5R6_19325 [Candidatus Heimdallarchaeota archaeon]
MKEGPVVWLVQRICAVFLIIGAPIKLITGYVLVRKLSIISVTSAYAWHLNPILDGMLVVGASFHVFYGIRTILLDLGMKREKELFWFVTLLSFIFSTLLLYFVYVG